MTEDCILTEDREIVGDKPRVTVKPQSSVFTGDTVTLRCDVRRSGRRIFWYKDQQRLQSVDETVTLRDVRVSDGGEYRCGVETQGPKVTLTVRGIGAVFYIAIRFNNRNIM